MANALYDNAREGFLDGSIDWINTDQHVVLVDLNDYSHSITSDSTLADIPSGARVATAGPLTGKSATDGEANAGDITFASASGDESEAVVIYQDGASDSDRRLVAFIDNATNLPVTPNGGDITVVWNTYIFRL